MLSKVIVVCLAAASAYGLGLGQKKLVLSETGYGQLVPGYGPNGLNLQPVLLKNYQPSKPLLKLQPSSLGGYVPVQQLKSPLKITNIAKPQLKLQPLLKTSSYGPVKKTVKLAPKYIDESPQPYDMSYEIIDDYGNKQARQESGDEYGNKQGSYSMQDNNGIWRQVKYVADEQGVKMWIQTNEPGTSDANPADVDIQADPVVVQTAPIKAYKPQIIKPLY